MIQNKQIRDFGDFPCVIIGVIWPNSQLWSNGSFLGQVQSAIKDTWNIWGHRDNKAAVERSWDDAM